MSPTAALKETNENTDFCYYVADRIAPLGILDSYMRVPTHRYVYQPPHAAVGNVRAIWIFIPRRYYISVERVHLSYRVIIAAAQYYYDRTSCYDKIHSRSLHRTKPSINGGPWSDLIVIIVTRISKVCCTAWSPLGIFNHFLGVPLRGQYLTYVGAIMK